MTELSNFIGLPRVTRRTLSIMTVLTRPLSGYFSHVPSWLGNTRSDMRHTTQNPALGDVYDTRKA
jgi:hypothetical protein